MFNKNLLIDIDYPVPMKDELGRPVSNSAGTRNFIDLAMDQAFPAPAHMDNLNRRVFARIQDKLDKAIENKEPTIELEKAEIDLLKKAFKDPGFPAAMSRVVVKLEDEVNGLGEHADPKPKTTETAPATPQA